MTAITFDTLAFSNKLKKAGCDSQQAETQAEAVADIVSGMMTDHVATQQDLKDLEARVDLRFKDLESKITMRFGAMLTAAVSILAALLLIVHN